MADSGVYSEPVRSFSDDQLLCDNVSSIKDFRKSQRVKKIKAQPRWVLSLDFRLTDSV